MGFFENVKKKAVEVLSGEHAGIQKHTGGGRRIGSMGKFGGTSQAVKDSSGRVGYDASTFEVADRQGTVGSTKTMGKSYGGGYDAVTKKAHVPERKPGGLGGFGGKVIGAANKGLDWMAERGNELNGTPKKRKGRAPRMSKEDSRLEDMYDPLMNERSAPRKKWVSQGTMFSGGEAYEEVKPRKKASRRPSRASGAIGGGMDTGADLFGVGNFGMGHEASESYAEEEREHSRRRKKGRKRAAPRERDEGNHMDPGYIPPSMRGMF